MLALRYLLSIFTLNTRNFNEKPYFNLRLQQQSKYDRCHKTVFCTSRNKRSILAWFHNTNVFSRLSRNLCNEHKSCDSFIPILKVFCLLLHHSLYFYLQFINKHLLYSVFFIWPSEFQNICTTVCSLLIIVGKLWKQEVGLRIKMIYHPIMKYIKTNQVIQ